MLTVIIDNYDSFTYNLAQAFRVLGSTVEVVRNDDIDVAGLERLAPDRLVISPGPGGPAGSAVSAAAIAHFRGRRPILGVCLGHQVLGEQFGGSVAPARRPVHGKRDWIHHDDHGIFGGLPNPFPAARYHSLIVGGELPSTVRRSAWTEDDELMGLGIPGEAVHRGGRVELRVQIIVPQGDPIAVGFRPVVAHRSSLPVASRTGSLTSRPTPPSRCRSPRPRHPPRTGRSAGWSRGSHEPWAR